MSSAAPDTSDPGAEAASERVIATGDPAADVRAFRRCLGQFATGVTLITAEDGGERVGVTANSFSSLSLDPPLILWSIAKSSRSHAAFSRASDFAVHVLAEDQIALSQRFASSTADKYDGLTPRLGRVSGAPVFDGTAAVLECETEALHDGGDHTIIVGRVREFSHYERDALVFVKGRYALAVDHPEPPAAGTDGTSHPAPIGSNETLYMLVFRAFHSMSEAFEEHRATIGVPLAQSRILIALQIQPGLTADVVAQRMYLSRSAAEDAAADLIESGQVSSGPAGDLYLTDQGSRLRQAIADHEAAFDLAQTQARPPAEIEATRRVLRAIVERNSGRE